MKTGELVEAVDFRGNVLLRKAVEIYVDTVFVCTPEEWELSLKEGREPICVGFPVEFVKALSRQL